jgi:hypothetical protein
MVPIVSKFEVKGDQVDHLDNLSEPIRWPLMEADKRVGHIVQDNTYFVLSVIQKFKTFNLLRISRIFNNELVPNIAVTIQPEIQSVWV